MTSHTNTGDGVEKFKEGDEVIVSWKEDEGGGWYSNKRKKKGIVHYEKGEMFVETVVNPRVRPSEMTAIRHTLNNEVQSGAKATGEPSPTEGIINTI